MVLESAVSAHAQQASDYEKIRMHQNGTLFCLDRICFLEIDHEKSSEN